MATGHYGFFQKKGGEIVRAPLVQWASYRRQGYKFVTEKDWQAQQAGTKAAPVEDVNEAPTMENTKAEILDYARANDIAVDENANKADLLAAIEDTHDVRWKRLIAAND